MEKKLDRRRKYYMVLDCETATLPHAAVYESSAEKQRAAIAKPLIYDFGWNIVDIKGNVYRRRSFLITEIFSVPSIFNTAYYAWKRPVYLERLAAGETTLTTWAEAVKVWESDAEQVEAVGAFNSMFDFKKAIPITSLYISKLYSPDYYEWEATQNAIMDSIAHGLKQESNRTFEPDVFRFNGKAYKLFDLWGLSCEHLINNPEYKQACVDGGWTTASGKYFKTSAETVYRFIMGEHDFDEAHMAIDDADIESIIFSMIGKKTKHNFEMGIIYFPFKILGTVENFNGELWER